jgi:hypothetical protein
VIDALLGHEQPAARSEFQQIPNTKQEIEVVERIKKQSLRLQPDQGRLREHDTA